MAVADTNNTMVFIDIATAQDNYGIWLRNHQDFEELSCSLSGNPSRPSIVLPEGRPHTMEFDDTFIETRENLGRALVDLGKPEEALDLLAVASDRLAELEKQTPGTSHLERRRADIDVDRGAAWALQKSWPKSIAAYEDALAILDAQTKSDPKSDAVRNSLPEYRSRLAAAYAGAGQLSEARTAMQTALANLRETESARKLAPEELQLRADAEAKLAAWK